MRTAPAFVSLCFALAAATRCPTAHAQAGVVVAHADSTASVSGARLAIALAPGEVTRWLEVSVDASENGFLWLVPASPGARVDTSSHDWLDALDDATMPTVVPPAGVASCDAAAPVEQRKRDRHRLVVSPLWSGVALDSTALATLVGAGGGRLSASQAEELGAVFQAGLGVVVLDYETGGVVATETIQIVETAAPEAASGVARANPADTPVPATMFVLGSERATTAEGWSTESALPGRLFQPLTTPGAPALPGVLHRYFELADGTARSTRPSAECDVAAAALEANESAVGVLCPAGGLASVPGPSPCIASPPDAVSPLPLLCGAPLSDAAFALAGLVPGNVWLTREAGFLGSDTANALPVAIYDGASVPVFMSAATVDSPCMTAPSAVSSPVGGYSSPSAPSSTPVPVSMGVPPSDTDDSTGTVVADVAEGAADTASGGCDGSSDSDDGSDSGCDSSSGSSDDASGCSGSGSSDPDPDCAVRRPGRHRRGAGVRFLVFGMTALALLRRAGRPRAR